MKLKLFKLIEFLSVPVVVLIPFIYAAWNLTHSEGATAFAALLSLGAMHLWLRELAGPHDIAVYDYEKAVHSLVEHGSLKEAERVADIVFEYPEQMREALGPETRTVRTTEELRLVWLDAANRTKRRMGVSESRHPYRGANG